MPPILTFHGIFIGTKFNGQWGHVNKSRRRRRIMHSGVPEPMELQAPSARCQFLGNLLSSLIGKPVNEHRIGPPVDNGLHWSLPGLWGLRACSLAVAQPSATVRNPAQPSARSPYGRAHNKFCKRGHFWRFHMWRCFVSRGTRGTSWHSDVLVTCRKSFCVPGAILWCRFHKMSCNFRGRRSTLDVSISFCVAGAVSRISCESHWQGGVKWRQGANGILWDVMKIDGSLARNIAFEVANFQVLRKTRRKTAILKLQSVKIGGVSLLGLMLPRVSSWAVASPCLWGKCKTSPFRMFPSRLSCRFAWQARRFVTFQPLW